MNIFPSNFLYRKIQNLSQKNSKTLKNTFVYDKPVHKMLMKLKPVLNVANILKTSFSRQFLIEKIQT